jgi:hypothetical protein
LTGEPYAGDPHVRFGGKGGATQCAILTPIQYDGVKGYWINIENGNPLMHEDAGFKPRTKKEDIETGEDRKGE